MPTMAPWTPAHLDLHAFYDAELSQPKNVGYVDLSGVSGDYIYCPHVTALSFSTDIELVVRVKASNWATGANQTLMGKYVSTGNQRQWRFYVSTSGSLGLTASVDGTAVTSVIVAPTVALPTARFFWMRLRLDLTNGANSVGTCDIAGDTGSNSILPLIWTANGSNVGSTISGIFNSTTAPLEIGSFTNGTNERLTGQVGRMILRSGFDGTTVADFNADRCYGPGYTDEYGNPWTLSIPKLYDVSGKGRPPATFGSGSNQPLWLPWEGRAQVYLPGTSGNSVSTPHVTHTGDFVARVQIRYDASTASFSQLIGDRSGGSTAEAQFRFGGSVSLLSLQWFESAVQTDVGTAASTHGLIDGQVAWLGVERINNNGGVYRVRFYKSIDDSPSLTDWTGWTLISEHNGAVPAAPTATTNVVSLGGPNNPLAGGVLRAVAFNNGVQTVDFVAASCGQSGYTDTLGNVWTVNRATSGRKTVVQSPAARSARSVILLGTDDLLTVPAAAKPGLSASEESTWLVGYRRWATFGSGSRVFDDRNSTTDTVAGIGLRSGFGTPADMAIGIGNGTTNAGGGGPSQFTSGVLDVSGALVATNSVATIRNGAVSSTYARTGSGTNANNLTIGAVGTPGSYIDFEEFAVLLFDRQLTTTELGLVVAYYGGGL